MAADPMADAEDVQAQWRTRAETLAAAAGADSSRMDMHATYETEDGAVRVTVDGRFRIAELHVDERLPRSPEATQTLVAAVNDALAAARAQYEERLRSGLDQETTQLLTTLGALGRHDRSESYTDPTDRTGTAGSTGATAPGASS